MKNLFAMLSLIVSFSCQSAISYINDGVYYSFWVTGDVDKYVANDVMSNDPQKIGNDFYFINNGNKGVNDEVYMLVNNAQIEFFYKHDEIEGGPSIGWATAKLSDNNILVDPPTVKNFYDETVGDVDDSIKYKVGEKFKGNNRSSKEREVIPLRKINDMEYKVDCDVYFEENVKYNNSRPPKDEPMKDYSKKILLNNNGICNFILDNKSSKGGVLFKKIL
ncbi:hypothetical protein [Lelliottia wanjuensis]|uniref:hypothetical protein n=1 Tax=Lelliottia wanjuensis TaxID=3050585 RepID=UPI00254FBDD1|nr:hypothetical protein [Lelliottia sp. V104_15]MDK9605693.1 hypothetical protein [Lelliottia sp. V104_15]